MRVCIVFVSLLLVVYVNLLCYKYSLLPTKNFLPPDLTHLNIVIKDLFSASGNVDFYDLSLYMSTLFIQKLVFEDGRV